jgi:hypothetical protein
MEEWLTEMPGVGDAIAVIISKLYRTGTHPSLEKLRKEIPARVLELLTVPGLRPARRCCISTRTSALPLSPSLRRRQYSRSVYYERSSTAE